jgi:hypothetical protein
MRGRTRKEKIKLLQAIKDGKLTPADLRPPQVYIFSESNLKPGVYEHKGIEYNETEYREFCEKIQRHNNGSIIWNEGRQYPKEDIIIQICRVDKKPLYEIKRD